MDNEEEDEVIFGQAAPEICKEHLVVMLIVRDNNVLLTWGTLHVIFLQKLPYIARCKQINRSFVLRHLS